jgi:hypothetical protein
VLERRRRKEEGRRGGLVENWKWVHEMSRRKKEWKKRSGESVRLREEEKNKIKEEVGKSRRIEGKEIIK